MTKQELLYFKMFPREEQIWSELCDSIRTKFNSLGLPRVACDELEKRLSPGTPYTYSQGYSETDGYFKVEAGDRGGCALVFKTHSREEAENYMVKSLAHDVSYQYSFCNRQQMELEKRGDWRFYEVIDGREPGRILSHKEENATWKYDTEYDYRKYWFEMALGMLKKIAPEEFFWEEVQRYEKLLNRWFEKPFWRFDATQMEFVCI